MLKTSWKLLSIVGMLHSAAVLADDSKYVDAEREALPEHTAKTLLAESQQTTHRDLHPSYKASNNSEHWMRPIADVNFQDANTMSRVSKLRSLSLLTLAEAGRTRLFLGVNHKGLVGLHFRAFSNRGADRHVEMSRMPYLKKPEVDDKADPFWPEQGQPIR